MQNAGQQYGGQGGNGTTSLQQHPQHQQATSAAPQYNQQDHGSNAGSVTTSLRQFRKEKQALQDGNTSVINENQHVARVAPHNHYPSLPRPSDCYRYPTQYQDYSLTPLDPSTGKPRPEAMCNALPPQSYADLHMAPPSRASYHQGAGQPGVGKREQDYLNAVVGGGGHSRRDNDFLSKLQRIHPSMARSIMSDHHMQEAAQASGGYRPPSGGVGGGGMDQNRMYATAQSQRYMNYGTHMTSPYGTGPPPHGFMSQTQGYPGSYHHPAAPPSANCSYPRSSHHPLTSPTSRYPHHPEREGTSNGLPYHHPHLAHQGQYANHMQKGMGGMGYPGAYPGQHPPSQEYAQHYQHRSREAYYQQHCRPSQYLPHQMTTSEIQENRVQVSNNLKQFLENWADEETVTEMQMETTEMCKEEVRVPREDQSAEIYMINASELQYFKDSGIPLVTDTGIPLQVTSENGQYIIKNGAALENSSGLRIFNKQSEIDLESGERVVNVHIMDPVKTDCMLAGKPNEPNQRKHEGFDENPRVVIHQNTILQSSCPNINIAGEQSSMKLPHISETDQSKIEDEITRSIIKECKKETVDKNCSPINLVELEDYKDESVIYPTKVLEEELDSKMSDSDCRLKNMPTIEEFDEVNDTPQEEDEVKSDKPIKDETTAIEMLADAMGDVTTVKIEAIEECDEKSEKSTTSNESTTDAIEADEAMIIENGNPLYNAEIANDNHDRNYKRTKRIFSVDDIINNIGSQFNKCKESNICDYKNFIEATRDFLAQETKNVFKQVETAKEEVDANILIKNEVEELKEKILAEIEDTEKISHSELSSDGDIQVVDRTEQLYDNSDHNIDNKEKSPDMRVQLCKADKVHITQNVSVSESAEEFKNDKEGSPIERNKRLLPKVQNNGNINTLVETNNKSLQSPDILTETTINESDGSLENVHSADNRDDEKQDIKDDIQGGIAIVHSVPERESSITNIEGQHNVSEDKPEEKEVENSVTAPKDDTVNVKENYVDKKENDNESISDTGVYSRINNQDKSSAPLDHQVDLNINKNNCQKTYFDDKQHSKPLEKEIFDEAAVLNRNKSENALSLRHEERNEGAMEQCEETLSKNDVNEIAQCEISTDVKTETEEPEVKLIKAHKSDMKCGKSIYEIVESDCNTKITKTLESAEKGEKSFDAVIEYERSNEADHIGRDDKSHTALKNITPDREYKNAQDDKKLRKIEVLDRKNTNEEEIKHTEINEEIIFVNSDDANCTTTDQLDCNAVSAETRDISKCSSCELDRLCTVSEDIVAEKSAKEPPEVPDQEVQYRNVIRVEDNSILLHIAGELVEINVNTVNGKKVITVVPLSSSTVVDFNDNYDTVDNISACDPLRIDEMGSESQDIEEKVGVPEFVEPTSEIIIGMDLNLEEEIQLDLEQPKPTICTKAAKKAYDCDLQIPSITTSEDVYEKSNTTIQRNNDKVSSSKEKQDKSKRKPKSSKDTETKSSHDKAGNVRKSRKKSSSKSDEEFIPFADLVKARKLKKSKLKQLKDKCKADSTNKFDEVKKVKNELVPSIPSSDQDGFAAILSVQQVKVRCTKSENRNSEAKDDVHEQPLHANTSNSPEADKKCVQEYFPGKNESKLSTEISNDNLRLKELTAPKVETKRKLSLEEYNNRKRKLMAEKELAAKKANLEKVIEQKFIEQKLTIAPFDRNISVPPKRSMSVDEPKPVSSQTRRSNSLEEFSKPVETNLEENRLDTLNLSRNQSGSTVFPGNNEPLADDEILRIYKEQVESKLSSLNLQIPKVTKPKPSPPNIIQRFLKNDSLTKAEVEKIKEIILCKKLMQLKSPEITPGGSNYEVSKEEETDMKLHLKKLPPKKKKLRFRNLYADSSESDEDFKSAATSSAVSQIGDYAVVQSNRTLAGAVPKLIIKRKTEIPLPVVRLERLDLEVFVNKKRKYE